MNIFEISRPDGYTISTDKNRLSLDTIFRFLSVEAYWAQGRPRDVIAKSIEHSLCFGVYEPSWEQVGFSRMVTDYATFAWFCDVYIDQAHRGLGLGKWMVEIAVQHPALSGVRRIILATRDAHELYRQHGGFETLPNPERWMVRFKK